MTSIIKKIEDLFVNSGVETYLITLGKKELKVAETSTLGAAIKAAITAGEAGTTTVDKITLAIAALLPTITTLAADPSAVVTDRLDGDKPPKLNPGEVVQFASVPTPGIFAGSLPQRPYPMVLDADHQEVGDRRWLTRQTFSDLDYAGRWAEWVTAQGELPMPDYPAGGV